MAIGDLSSVLKIFGRSSPSEENQDELYKEVLLETLARASRSDANIHPMEIETIQEIMQRETGFGPFLPNPPAFYPPEHVQQRGALRRAGLRRLWNHRSGVRLR